MNTEFKSADQNWQNETTTYWFELSGHDAGTDIEFECDTFGIVEGASPAIVDCDGFPLTPGDVVFFAVKRHAVVTDEIRKEASGL